jgi:hypothetical protein
VSLDVLLGFELPLTLPWIHTSIADHLTVTP